MSGPTEAIHEVVDAADVGGRHDEHALRGDARVTEERRATSGSRRRLAVQAALDTLVPVEARMPVAAEALSREREAVAARGGIVMKTAAKVATDEHSWQQYVDEQGIEVGSYPTEAHVVEFAVWLSRRRERVCLAQRAESAAAAATRNS